MKLSILALGASCASILAAAPCAAQLHIESASPTVLPAPTHLVAQSGAMPDNPFTSGSLSGMFDAAKNAVGLGIEDPSSGRREDNSTLAEISDPQALVGSQRQSAPVPTSAPAATPTALTHPQMFQAPHINDVPLVWPDGPRGVRNPYNPTFSVIVQNWCTQGLWDSYPAQAAAECAAIQRHLSGHHGCVHGPQGGCGHCGNGCSTPINRYTTSSPNCNGGCAGVASQQPYPESTGIASPMNSSAPTPAPQPNMGGNAPSGQHAPISILNTTQHPIRVPANLPPPPAFRPANTVQYSSEPVTAQRQPAVNLR